MISIVIPVYNQAKLITQTLNSLSQQSYQDFEVIIVNDGSTDNLNLVLEKYLKTSTATQRFFVINQKNLGAPAARNRGFKETRGEYLLFCDADAVMEKNALELMVQALIDNPSASYVYSSFRWGSKLFKLWPFDAERLRQMPYIHTMSLMRREAFPSTGWDESIKKLQDWDLWLTLLEKGQTGVFINQVLFQVKPGGTISSWLPKFTYKLLPFIKAARKYQTALQIVKQKHNLL
jgi:glycosyltransferase involved in cell wall biosynthesis